MKRKVKKYNWYVVYAEYRTKIGFGDPLNNRLEKAVRRFSETHIYAGRSGGWNTVGWNFRTQKAAEKAAERLRRFKGVKVEVTPEEPLES